MTARRDTDPTEQPPRVLLVDDDALSRLLIGTALRQQGFVVQPVDDGDAALAALADSQPDVVVLDAVMPGRDGFATCRAMRERPALAGLPVLMLTGLEDEASIQRAYDAGATDFFVKSSQWALLGGRLRHLLRASRVRLELERKRAELARAQRIARMGSFQWRAGGFGVEASDEAAHVLGWPATGGIELRAVLRRMDPPGRRMFLQALREALATLLPLTVDLHLPTEDGGERLLHLEAEPSFGPTGHLLGYAGIVQDVTERRAAEDRIHQLAHYDALTGLPNRRELIRRAEHALELARRDGQPLALLLVGLDRLKVVNDTLGHAAGDEMLRRVAFRLRTCVRHAGATESEEIEGALLPRHDDVLGRLGSDEFVVLLSGSDREMDAVAVADRLQEALRAPLLLAGQEVFLTASIGVALYPRDGHSVPDLLRQADAAMRAAKDGGRNAVMVYQSALAGGGREKLAIESALHKAIERGELVLHYQPKLCLQTGRLAGVEALMRWQRGDRLVPPAEFIPLAEENGLIVPMSIWALDEAARQAALWQARDATDGHLCGPIAVNLPTRLFERNDLVAQLRSATERHCVPPGALQLEITETGLMKDLQTVIPTLHRLHELGVGLSIDDFGTGYSSLAYLTTLPLDELKIDRSFIRDLGVTPQSGAVVAAIIALARALSLKVVAEGVETPAQLETLRALGCDCVQGFLVARPLPAGPLQAWIDHLPSQGLPWQDVLAAPLPPVRSTAGGAAPADAGPGAGEAARPAPAAAAPRSA